MIGYAVTLTPPGGTPTDYTVYTLSAHIDWPASTDVPTATVIFSNTGGIFPSVPLFGTLAITLPNNLGTFYFAYEQEDFQFSPMGGPGMVGRQMQLTATSSPELLFMTEGNLDVVGTDLPVGQWNSRGTTYAPYPSTFVTGLQTSLMDIGNVLTGLVHAVQPKQLAGYRGRLGYDVSGAGIQSSGYAYTTTTGTSGSGQKVLTVSATTGFSVGSTVLINPAGLDGEVGVIASINPGVSLTMVANLLSTHAVGEPVGTSPAQVDFTQGSSTNWSPYGLYIKGQWKVGLGQTGAQKTGLDVIRDVCQTNVIDGTGTPQVVDFYIDPTQTPAQVVAFERATILSGVTLTVGTDPIQSLDLPVDTSNVKNCVVYWVGAETTYPNGDAWSDYDTTAHLQSQWSFATVTGSGSVAVSTAVSTTVSSTSLSGQTTLNVTATTGFLVDAPVIINPGGSNSEVAVVSSIGAGTLVMTADLQNNHFSTEPVVLYSSRYNAGSSMLMTNSSTSTPYVNGGTLTLATLGYRVLNAVTNQLTGFKFSLLRLLDDNVNDEVTVGLNDSNGGFAGFNVTDVASHGIVLGTPGVWQDIVIPIPQSGSGDWQTSGGFDFKTSEIVSVSLVDDLGSNGSYNQAFFLDQLGFQNSWNFAPVYDNNTGGATATTLTVSASAGASSLTVQEIPGFLPGQWAVLDVGNAYYEKVQIASVTPSTGVLTLVSPTVYAHNATNVKTTLSAGIDYAGQPILRVNSVVGFVAGATVLVSHNALFDTYSEYLTILTVGISSLVMTSNLQYTYAVGDTVAQNPAIIIGGTSDPNSIAAFGYRIFNYVDYYVSSGSSDSAASVALNILTTRKGKSSSGNVTVWGYCPQLQSIKPGYVFDLIAPEDTYAGNKATNSVIVGWIADNIAYDIQSGPLGGFTATLTVEPYYSVIGTASSDRNPRDFFALNNRTVSRNLRTLNRMSLPGGRTSIR